MDRYRILLRRRCQPDDVELSYDPSNHLMLSAEQQSTIHRRCSELRQAGRKVEQNPLYRLLGWQETPRGLRLRTGAVDYETYLGLSLSPDPPVVVTIAAATEVEGRLVLEQRGQLVAQGAGMLHVKPSGHVHPPQTPWQACLAETEEELGLRADELIEPEFLGLVRSLTAPCVSLVYRFHTQLSWNDLLQRKAVDAWEYEHLLGLPLDRESLERWLLVRKQEATGPGLATVLLEGWARFGEEWFQRHYPSGGVPARL